MSVRCSRFAKENILDGEASFDLNTFAKVGPGVYSMRGQVIGHNAFNARIAKAATCKVHMDWKTNMTMYDVN